MRKADRLFQIVQILRRTTRPVTADAIAAELETSKRSVYRDIAALIGQRVPIRGEAGIGYVLEGGFDLPPLMLTADEIDAVALGAQWVAGHADPALARAARDVLAKVAAVLPEEMRGFLEDPAARTPPAWDSAADRVDASQLRAQIRAGRKVAIRYTDLAGARTERTVWPLVIGYLDAVRVLIGWCEMRAGFRSFRLDRIDAVELLDTRIPIDPATLRRQWRSSLNAPANH
ncbi:putative DNA-binding transcriptional regulator YafY [Sphingomonas naasensis]|uniref:YafY family transcriptional regulator n=1 Tax=Sphingomonas naasensis TaxID=1344951 RepID=A0A4S1WCG9_9SPHN|nr:YafY family protein [Sphingomonas naasensis]NIJ22350.1 putative DNA-binding transcriptional regulator YafY [Sphingomonas naasensis]TGX40651.1 YafY family transcriptional regulator [Sphingomonas naasensis]